jgi:hypothetical protein
MGENASGRHWQVIGDRIEVFGLPGEILEKPPAGVVGVSAKWAIGFRTSEESDYVLYSANPTYTWGRITALIRESAEPENIDHILISSCWAVLLWLNGDLKTSDLEAAEEDGDSIVLILVFGGEEYRVIVKDERQLNYHAQLFYKDES